MPLSCTAAAAAAAAAMTAATARPRSLRWRCLLTPPDVASVPPLRPAQETLVRTAATLRRKTLPGCRCRVERKMRSMSMRPSARPQRAAPSTAASSSAVSSSAVVCASRHASLGRRAAADVRAQAAAGEEPLMVRAARGEAVERAPCWMMRQAGR
eukprot:365436-Chlamydomonas_euryale.AAC.14